ncbi:MAG TPA: geranylgeranyl reductase family protein [Streptosporangiaceae bacterium]|nr:geranylgeranyl reductase family protein [Streptosporangiaceae bacterium]
MVTSSDTADVIVVGAGPAGSSVAYYLATAGLDVLLLEKTSFPREKVCGDGLTPRAVKALTAMGIQIAESDGWPRNKGLRIIGGGGRIELAWPDLSVYPGFGMVRTRTDFDEILARHAQKAGARLLENVTVTGALVDDRTGRVAGVRARQAAVGKAERGDAGGGRAEGRGRAAGSAAGAERTFGAPLVIAADGNSSRLSVSMGLRKRDDRPLGVAVRTYYTTPRHDDDYLEAWLDLWDGEQLLPGYGWIFGMGDGTSNVGLGLLNTSESFGHIDYRALLRRWLAATPAEWGFAEENRTEPVRGAALPMAFNRTPHYTRGLVLVGDAAGLVNPFNGEGIAYAMESGELAARSIVQALARPTAAGAERVMQGYPAALRDAYGGYYALGRTFVKLIGKPSFMQFATRHGIKRPAVMRMSMKLLGNLTEPRGGDAVDRVINALSKMTPAA